MSRRGSTRTPAIRLDGVTKRFGDVTAVDDVSLGIDREEFLTILGPSGAGKTSLLHMIAGFTEPTDGEIYIDGDPVTDVPPYEREIGMVFQSMALFPHMTVGENVAFPLEMRRYDPDRIDERVREMLELIQLPDIADRDVTELSGGQRQRVAIARALAFEPTLLLLDEPLSSLDKKLRGEMRRELLRIHRTAGVTTVHVTHNQEEALTMADRIAVIDGGEIAQHASAEELYDRPNSPFIADFIGDTTLLSGRVREHDGRECTVELAGGEPVRCLPAEAPPPDPGTPVQVGLRYERIVAGETVATDNAFDATVREVAFEGDTVTYEVDLDGGVELSVTELNTTGTRVFERGREVAVGWNAGDEFLYPATEG